MSDTPIKRSSLFYGLAFLLSVPLFVALPILIHLESPGMVSVVEAARTKPGMTTNEVRQVLGETGYGFRKQLPDGRESWEYMLHRPSGAGGSKWLEVEFDADGRLDRNSFLAEAQK